MLHMIMQIKRVPVIYWKEPYFQSKFKHPQEVAELWDLDVYDYPPTATNYLCIDDYFDVYNYYYIAQDTHMILYTGTRNYTKDDKKYLCAIENLMNRPKVPSYEFNWDCIFHGHKQCDPMYITERVELPLLKTFGNGLLALPIRDWTDAEIWDYIKKYNLPYNKDRYDDKKEVRNNDMFPTCHDCLDPNNSNGVFCKKYNKHMPFLGKSKEDNLRDRDSFVNKLY